MKLCIDDDNIILASFPVRLVAYLIDLIIINICSLFMKIPLMFVKLFAPNIIIFKAVLFNFTLVDIFFYILSSAYFILTVYCNGATIGKTLMNIKVIGNDGNKLSLFNIIYRETVGRYLSSILYIGYILIFINKDKKSLHDILSNTQVVYDKNNFKVIPVYKEDVDTLDKPQDKFVKQNTDLTVDTDENIIEVEVYTDDNDNQS